MQTSKCIRSTFVFAFLSRSLTLQDNLFELHFTLPGANGTPFEGGIYHGVIKLPPEYPRKPPAIIFLTVRFAFASRPASHCE